MRCFNPLRSNVRKISPWQLTSGEKLWMKNFGAAKFRDAKKCTYGKTRTCFIAGLYKILRIRSFPFEFKWEKLIFLIIVFFSSRTERNTIDCFSPLTLLGHDFIFFFSIHVFLWEGNKGWRQNGGGRKKTFFFCCRC